MKLAHSLYLETLGLLLLYLSALIAVVFIVFNTHFGAGWDALLQSPLGDKVDTVANAVSTQLRSSPEKKWDEVLDLFGGLYHVKFSVFDMDGQQLAGEKVILPQAVLDQFAIPMVARHIGGRSTATKSDYGPGRFITLAPPMHVAIVPFDGPPPRPADLPGLHAPPPFADRLAPPASSHRGPPPGSLESVRAWPPPGPGDRPEFYWTFRRPGEPLPPPDSPYSLHDVSFPPHDSRFLRHEVPFPHAPMPAHGRFLVHTTAPDHFYFGTRIDLAGEKVFRPGPSILVASTDNIWQTGLLLDFKMLAMAGGAIALFSILFWLPFIYRITRALSDLTLATERIADGKFDTRLITRRQDEIGRLSDAVNSMAEKLSGFVGGQKRFLADISHELFSPLARLQVALEILDGSSTKDQRAIIEDIREEVEEMNHLINELIAFSKAELKGQTRQLTSVNVKEIFCDLLDRLSLNKSAQVDIADGLCVVGDKLLLERSFSNVLRNSVRYAGDSGPISIKAIVAGNDVFIIIQDRGPGVPPESLKNLAEPFFRLEPSRNRESGGVGLGLAIVKSCIEACNGKLQVRNREGGGLEVEVELQVAAANESSDLQELNVST